MEYSKQLWVDLSSVFSNRQSQETIVQMQHFIVASVWSFKNLSL